MGKIGTIGVIPKDYSGSPHLSMEKSLRERGFSMAPGTGKLFMVHRDLSGSYRTGLDPEAGYILNIEDKAVREAEQARVQTLHDWLKKKLNVDLSPDSKYWKEIPPFKLTDGDNIFNLEEPFQALTFAWLRVYPTIASSLEAYQSGQYPHDTHFYVKDTEIETKTLYNQKKKINDAVAKIDAFDLAKRRKVARLVGLPIGEEDKEEVVYNALDNFLKEKVVKMGPYKGQTPLNVFGYFSDLNENILLVKDLVEQSLSDQIYRVGIGAKIEEGGQIIFQNKEEMTKFFLDDKNQKDLLELQKKIKLKRQVAI